MINGDDNVDNNADNNADKDANNNADKDVENNADNHDITGNEEFALLTLFLTNICHSQHCE